MAKPFKCAGLEPEIVETIRRLVTEERATYEQVHEHIKAMGADVSSSAVARYGRHLRKERAELEHTRELARELLDIGDGLDLQDLAARLVSVKLLAVVMQNEIYIDSEDGLSLGSLIAIARAVATLQSSALAREKYRADMKARAEEAARDIAQTAERGGLSDTTVDAIRRRVLGLGEAS